MSPFLKGLLAVVGGLILLLGVALTVVALTFDPNDYKGQIQAEVQASTGRELQLSGPLSLSLFPWLGVQAENVRLANAAGFTDPDMASLRKLDARLRLWPLLRGEIEIGRILVDGLTLNLERRADGSNNWQDLGAPTEPQQAPEAPPKSRSTDLSGLRLAGIDISDARIQWRDAGELTVVEGLNLQTGPIAEGEPSELLLTVAISLADATRIELRLETGWQFSLGGPSAALDGLVLSADVSGDAVPGGAQHAELAANAHYDGGLQRASLSEGQLRFAGQSLSFSGTLNELDGAQTGQFKLEAKALQLREVAEALKLALPAEAAQWPALNLVADAQAALAEGRIPAANLALGFGKLQLSADAAVFRLDGPAGQGHVHLAPLDLHAFLGELGYGLEQGKSKGPTHLDLDWTLAENALTVSQVKGALAGEALSGELSLKQFQAPVIRANFDLAALRLADWKARPAGQDKAPAPGPDGGSINDIEVPMDWARDLNLTARAAIRQLNAYGVRFSDVIWTADARPGKPVTQSLRANAYGGQLSLDNRIDATQKQPQIGVNLAAKAIGLGDFLKDGWGSRWVTGTTELGLNLSSQGNTVGKMRSTANGEASYRLKDGEVQGVSLVDVLRKASATLQGEKHTASADSTSFQELFGRAVVESGKLKMREFGGGNDWLKLAGEGFVDLLEGRYDLLLSPRLLDNERARQDKYLSRLIGLAIPVSVTGPLTAPKFQVDLDKLAKEKARSKLKDKEDELRDKAKEKLGDFLRKL